MIQTTYKVHNGIFTLFQRPFVKLTVKIIQMSDIQELGVILRLHLKKVYLNWLENGDPVGQNVKGVRHFPCGQQ